LREDTEHQGPAPQAVQSVADRIATAGTVMFVDSRGYPMFAALFAYGLAQIHRRRTGQGRAWRWVRALLRRRSRWMIVFGAAHAALLFFGDVLAVYGLLGLVFVGALRFRDRTLVILALVWLPLGAVIQALLAAGQAMTGQTGMPPIPDGFVDELVFRLTLYAFMLPVMLINTVVPFLVGILAARHRVLEEPQRHLRLLRVTAFVGIPVGVLGGLPLALGKTGAWSGYSSLDALTAGGLHQVTGYAAGFGYAAPIALVAVRLSDRQGPVADALLHQSVPRADEKGAGGRRHRRGHGDGGRGADRPGALHRRPALRGGPAPPRVRPASWAG
jgi:uncharacterized membrane protein YeiB